jgi:Flp pilus assembly protein TadG
MKRKGQSMVEATFVLLAFFSMLIGVIDCGQVLLAHQSLVERVRGAARWGALHPYDGTGDQVANLVLYNQTSEPAVRVPPMLGLTRANVEVRYRTATPERPDDQALSVAIVNYEYHFFSPWLSRPFVNPRPVSVTVPCAILSVGDHPSVPSVPLLP